MNEGALTKKERMRIELAVKKINWELDGRVPRARRRQILDELRSNLTEAAQHVGAEQAVRQLGDLKALANSYLELYRSRFDARAGAFWAFIAYAAIQLLGFALFFAFRAGVAAGGAHGARFLSLLLRTRLPKGSRRIRDRENKSAKRCGSVPGDRRD